MIIRTISFNSVFRKSFSTGHFRVRVHDTQEEQVFDTFEQAKTWCNSVQVTFNDPKMKFDIIRVVEDIMIY